MHTPSEPGRGSHVAFPGVRSRYPGTRCESCCPRYRLWRTGCGGHHRERRRGRGWWRGRSPCPMPRAPAGWGSVSVNGSGCDALGAGCSAAPASSFRLHLLAPPRPPHASSLSSRRGRDRRGWGAWLRHPRLGKQLSGAKPLPSADTNPARVGPTFCARRACLVDMMPPHDLSEE